MVFADGNALDAPDNTQSDALSSAGSLLTVPAITLAPEFQ